MAFGGHRFPPQHRTRSDQSADLVRRIVTATELGVRRSGVHWAFASYEAVYRDLRWEQSYDSYDGGLVCEASLACFRSKRRPTRRKLKRLPFCCSSLLVIETT
ncbi:uncharacterized protein LOC18015982 isoform X2 [Eutrema salsugineum]|uniref:uncharacterized protein LOC18015982 isoform X2 n=1 Tax=Eutrema salsugineum TaxID=72664 RepID=UPI000CECF2F1|nr:uncharacterized protein LOC18015982 isoform X2 [Eutrema salsugineum]